MGQQQLPRSSVRLFPMQPADRPTDQPFISGKKSRFLLTADAPCAVCERRSPKTRNERSEGAEVQWAKLEFSNGLNAERTNERRSCRFFVPAQLRFRLIGSRRGKRATGKANLNRRRDADCTTVPAPFQRGEESSHS